MENGHRLLALGRLAEGLARDFNDNMTMLLNRAEEDPEAIPEAMRCCTQLSEAMMRFARKVEQAIQP